MHYIICYDLEDDRRRAKAAKILQKHGCERVQRSVFVAPRLEKKHLVRLRSDLRRLLSQRPDPGDSLLILPLRDEHAAEVQVMGHNNILKYFQEDPLKIIL